MSVVSIPSVAPVAPVIGNAPRTNLSRDQQLVKVQKENVKIQKENEALKIQMDKILTAMERESETKAAAANVIPPSTSNQLPPVHTPSNNALWNQPSTNLSHCPSGDSFQKRLMLHHNKMQRVNDDAQQLMSAESQLELQKVKAEADRELLKAKAEADREADRHKLQLERLRIQKTKNDLMLYESMLDM